METIVGMDAIAFWIVVTGALVNISGALLGNYLVLRKMSMIGDAISHAVLPGLALAFIVSESRHPLPMLVGAAAAGLVTVLLTELIHRYARIAEDASIGVVFTSMFALGVILISRAASQVDLDADCVLYGILESAALDTVAILGVDVPLVTLNLGLTTVGIVAFVLLLWKELKLVSFDPGLATAVGIRPAIVHYLLMFLVASFTVVAFEAVGSILVVAMLVVPSATALMLTDRLEVMAILSVLVGIASSVLGRELASVYETSVAGMMAVAAGGLLVLAVLFSPRHGYVARRWLQTRTAIRIALEDTLALLYRLHERNPKQRISRTGLRDALGSGWVQQTALFWAGRLGYLSGGAGGVTLTSRGIEAGSSLVHRHRLWESWLAKHTTLEDDHLHASAHRMEHFLDEGMTQAVAAASGHPERDPHGRPIRE